MHEKPIPGFTLISAHANQPPHRLLVKRSSPQFEYIGVDWAPGDPEEEETTWTPITGAAGKISAGLEELRSAGQSIIDQATSEVRDVGSTIYAAFTGEAPAEPGPIFEMAAGAAARLAAAAPAPLQKILKPTTESDVAGYVYTSDGRAIPVGKYKDPVTTAEKARAGTQSTASRAPSYDAALERAKLQLASQKEKNIADQWNRTFALKEKQTAQQLRIQALQERALELAIERETTSPAQRALWGRPTFIPPEEPKHRTVKQIGPGVPGGIQQRLY